MVRKFVRATILLEFFVTDAIEATIFTDVMTRTVHEAPQFLRKFLYGCGDWKRRFYRSYILHVAGRGISTETGA